LTIFIMQTVELSSELLSTLEELEDLPDESIPERSRISPPSPAVSNDDLAKATEDVQHAELISSEMHSSPEDTSDGFTLEPPRISLPPLPPPWGSDPVERAIVQVIQNLVNFELSPFQAAQDLDDIAFSSSRCPRNLRILLVDTSEEAEDQPSYRAHFALLSIPWSMPRIPADHPGQERIVDLLGELQKLPSRTVTLIPEGGSREERIWSRISRPTFGFVEDYVKFWESSSCFLCPSSHCDHADKLL
jgi:hypothetical protein